MLHRSLGAGNLQVVADPEGIVHEEEHPRDDVFDQGLGAEADRQAEDTGAGNQGADVHPQGR